MKTKMKTTICFGIVTALFTGCFTSGESENAGGTDLVMGSSPSPISFTDVEDKTYLLTDTTIVKSYSYQRCGDNGVLESKIESYEKKYLIAEGVLYLWGSDYDCSADIFTGNGSNLEGTIWTYAGVSGVPGKDSSESCIQDSYEPEGIKHTVVYNQGTITHQLTGNYCWAQFTAQEQFNATALGCNTVEIDYGELGKVNWTMSSMNLETGTRVESSSYNGKTCTLNLPSYKESKMTESMCQQAWNDYTATGSTESFYWDEWVKNPYEIAYTAYIDCKRENGFPQEELNY